MTEYSHDQNLRLAQQLLEQQEEINRLKAEPHLGLATTRQLLEELETRLEVSSVADPDDRNKARSVGSLYYLKWVRNGLSESLLDYRTIDS